MSSGLGKAIGLTSSSTWTNIVNAIKGIANRGTNQYAGGVGQGTDYIALNKIPVGYYGPANGSWSPEIRTPKSNFGSATAAQVLSGATFTSTAGLKSTGTMKDYSNSIQTATTSTSDQSKSCYRLNSGNIEVVPSIGYWGMWDWSKSCIKIPISSCLKTLTGVYRSSSSTYPFKDYVGNVRDRYYLSIDMNYVHNVIAVFYINKQNSNNYFHALHNGYILENEVRWRIEMHRTHSTWETDRYLFLPEQYNNEYTYDVTVWYI